jgi:hypothetical protein
LGRYQGFRVERNVTLLFGLKLPTGSAMRTGQSDDPANPQRVLIDPGLQPGTGTSDVILGLSYTTALNKDWDVYAETFGQWAINTANDYRPGDGYNLNLGVRYFRFSSFATPQLQLNSRYVLADTGGAADVFSTGGTLVYLSPGVVVPIVDGTEVYGFFQVPVYQYVLGVQLAPEYTYSIGARHTF